MNSGPAVVFKFNQLSNKFDRLNVFTDLCQQFMIILKRIQKVFLFNRSLITKLIVSLQELR